jgi:hypothetical protein
MTATRGGRMTAETRERALMLARTALGTLPRMLDRRSGLFVYTVRPTGAEGRSVRYTCITLLGLIEAARAGLDPGLDVAALVRGVAERRASLARPAERGLLLWLLADHHGTTTGTGRELVRTLDVSPAALGALSTTELGWVLTGLCRTTAVGGGGDVRTKAERVYAALRANLTAATGLYCFGGRAGSIRRRLRRRLGFFDNQVYGAYASVAYADAFGDRDALAAAARTVRTITAAQGPLGQWPWHWDVRRGTPVDEYPVYAVHQDGMALMALSAVSERTGQDVGDAFTRSVAWVSGENELGRPLVDREGWIWRSIRVRRRDRRWGYAMKALSLAGLPGLRAHLARHIARRRGFEVDTECRPYHLGWLLFALSRPATS